MFKALCLIHVNPGKTGKGKTQLHSPVLCRAEAGGTDLCHNWFWMLSYGRAAIRQRQKVVMEFSIRYSLFTKHFLNFIVPHILFCKLYIEMQKSVILWHQQEGRIRCLSLVSPLNNNNLAFIHRQKFLCGNCGVQVGDCKTLVQSKTNEIHFESQVYT